MTEQNIPISISYVLYESVHGKKPARNKRGDWLFYPPRIYGQRPYRITDVTFAEAERKLDRTATRGGEWTLKP